MLSGTIGRRPSFDTARVRKRSTGESMYLSMWRMLPPSSWCVSASTIVILSRPRSRACLVACARCCVVSNASTVSAFVPLEGNFMPATPVQREGSAGVDRFAGLVVLPGLEPEQLRRVAAQDVAFGLLGEERYVIDRRRQVEVPVRVVGREA